MSDSIPLSDLARPPAAKFDNIGERAKGTIAKVSREQQTDLDTGQALVWPDGKPRLQLVVTLDVADGSQLCLYAKGGKFDAETGEGVSMEQAIVDAVKAAGDDAVRVGALLEVVHSGLGKRPSPGKNPPKLYRAQYTKPTAGVPIGGGSSGLFSDEG